MEARIKEKDDRLNTKDFVSPGMGNYEIYYPGNLHHHRKATLMQHTPKFSFARLGVTTAITVALAVCSTAFAQITVTNATFPGAGDTLKMAYDNAPAAGVVTITPPDFNSQTWDFSGLQADATQNIVFRPGDEGSVQVPGAELFALTSPTREEYYNVTSNDFELQANYGINFDIVLNSLFHYNPPLPERHAPLNFFDIYASSSNALERFHPSAFPPALIAALPFSADSLRYRIYINFVSAVDAWGNLSIPGGTYIVLREKRTRYRQTRLDAKIPPLGWLDITDIASQYGFQGLYTDTTITYYFRNDVAKEPIAVVNTGSNGLIAQQVTFKHNPAATPVAAAANNLPGSDALRGNYPNPFNPATTLLYDMAEPGEVQMAVYNVLGQKLRTLVAGMQPAGRHRLVWDAKDDSGTQVTSGVYLVRMYVKGKGQPVLLTHKMLLTK